MKCFFLFWGLMFYYCSFSQEHSDAKEYGINGKVKQVVTYAYDSVILDKGEWIPVASAFNSRTTYFFNESGNIDSTHFLLRNKEEGRDIWRRVIYQFSNNKRSGYREYEERTLLETAVISWIDAFNYLTRVKYQDSDDITEIMNSLSPGYRDLRGEVRIFNNEGAMVYCSSYINTLEGNIISFAVSTDCMNEIQREEKFIYLTPDNNNNPLVVVALDKKSGDPKAIRVRKIEYY